ncbi:type II secretion system protein [Candidatus Saccharibacteria bacterium]|nr:type II secretion system protein [Candidatus Saccharibacteria bacterium]
MSFNNIKTKMKSERGFTIVELLIVIVVIGILAAITIVAYNGVTARANTTSNRAAANSFAKKAEIYNADATTNRYPIVSTELTSAASTSTFFLSGVTINYSTTALTSAASNSTIRVLKCASGAPASQAAVTGTNITGLVVYSFDYSTNAETTTPIVVGANTTVPGNCPTV